MSTLVRVLGVIVLRHGSLFWPVSVTPKAGRTLPRTHRTAELAERHDLVALIESTAPGSLAAWRIIRLHFPANAP
jgi:hypothetical protein